MDPNQIRSQQQLLLVQDGVDFDLSAPNDPTASAQKSPIFFLIPTFALFFSFFLWDAKGKKSPKFVVLFSFLFFSLFIILCLFLAECVRAFVSC